MENNTKNKPDWTEKDDLSNSSDLFHKIVDDIDDTIRENAHALLAGNSQGVARHIVARIAHIHNLSPNNE